MKRVIFSNDCNIQATIEVFPTYENFIHKLSEYEGWDDDIDEVDSTIKWGNRNIKKALGNPKSSRIYYNEEWDVPIVLIDDEFYYIEPNGCFIVPSNEAKALGLLKVMK